MRQALIIAYFFPPSGGVGVQRTVKFVKYLPQFSWIPHVLTVNSPKFGLHDEGLLSEIPTEAIITHTPAALLPRMLPWRVREFISRWILLVDEQVGWLPFAIQAGKQIIKDNHIDVIYSTSAPYSSHMVARQLHLQFKIPWVADFRDPWIGNSNIHFPTLFHRKVAERMEGQVVREATQVIVVSSPMGTSFYKRYPGIPASKISVIPNGYDGDDFLDTEVRPREKGYFNLTYTGSFYAKGLTARAILESIHEALQSGEIPRQHLRLLLVGNIGRATQKWIEDLQLGDVVDTPGFVSHKESISYMLAADALLLITGTTAHSPAVLTGKLFEYLATGKPILCLANEGAAADLIRKTCAGFIVSPENIPQITRKLAEIYHLWEEGKLSISPDQDLIRTFERRYLTAGLAKIFDELVVPSPDIE